MRSLFEQFDRIPDFPHQQRGRVELRGGSTVVRIYDPRQVKPEFETRALTIWDKLPELKSVAISAYIRVCTHPSIRSHSTRNEYAGLFRRLAKIMIKAGIDDRTPATLTYYDCEDILGEIGALQLKNPHQMVSPLREIVSEIWQDARLDGVRDPHLFVRKSPFPGSSKRGDTREVLPDALFGDIYARSAADCARIMADVIAFKNALVNSPGFDSADPDKLRTPQDCAVWLYGQFGLELPQLNGLKQTHKGVVSAIRRVGGWKDVIRLIHPTVRELVPFMALLGCQTLFNKAVMTELGLDDVERRLLAGTQRIVLTPLKRRAGRQQLRSFQIDNAPDNPDTIIRFLEYYTAGLRGLVEPQFSRRLFLFWSLTSRRDEDGTPGPSAFTGVVTGTGSEDSRFSYAWSVWCKEAGFEGVQFSALRTTGLNIAHRAFGGDVQAISALASHSSAAIFENHYKSPQSRARNDRKIGKAMLLRERLLASHGKVDPARRLRGEGVQAATPGFCCLDPFSSPIPGQRAGRPCAAYGQCPGCPLATTDIRVPANLVRMKQLEAEYMSAATYLAPHYWRDKYSEHLNALRTDWLPTFSDLAVIEQAAKMQARPLPPLG